MQVDYIVKKSDSSDAISSMYMKSDLELSPSIIKIYVYQPFIRIRQIKLNSNSPISTLNRMYPSDSIYIYYGQVLDVQKSFSYYGISDDNKIVLLPFKSNNTFVDKWLQLTSDKENFEQRVELNIKNSSKKELARIRDIKFNKIELKRKCFGSYLKSRNIIQSRMNPYSNNDEIGNYLANYQNSSDDGIVLQTNYEKSDAPSNNPLPILW